MCHYARKGHAEGGISVAGVGRPAILQRHRGILPRAPVGGGPFATCDIRLLVEQAVVGSYEVAIALVLGHTAAEVLPLLGEVAAHLVVQPVDVTWACHG